MKILQPNWVHHDDKPIFSVDVHPSGEKFATGGLGGDSGRVVVWNFSPVSSEKDERDKNVPKLLCQMDNHLACVNCVRWSTSGLYLASGADDKLVMIWKKAAGTGAAVFGGGLSKHAENWRCISTLRGHSGDVLDIAWSPQDRWLATCSVDNTIIIWDAQQFQTIVSILKGHTGLVKGVTWDPVGKYLASQSDDKSLKIWKTSDWSCSTTITEPFDECGGTTHILRLSWSPDGQYLVSAHAMNGGGPTAQIIERDGWKTDKDFVGHRKAVTCVRFHNSILKKTATKTNKAQQYCCLAIGARDKKLSIWLTALQRPLVVIHDLFKDSILDLSWSVDGYTLLACSGDGKVACLQFTSEELGKPLSEEDKNCLYQRMYGKNANIDITSQTDKDMIIENVDLLHAAKTKAKPPSLIPENERTPIKIPPKEIEPLVIKTTLTQPQSQPAVSPIQPILKQIETKTKDGKRRITPMFIPTSEETPTTTASNHQHFTSSSTTATSTRIDVQTSEISKPISSPITVTTTADQSAKLDNRLTKSSAAAPMKTVENQIPMSVASATPSVTPRTEYSRPQPFTAGKAAAIQGVAAKSLGEFRVQFANDNVKSSFGTLCKVVCYNSKLTTTDKKAWEMFLGSPIVSFAICFNYVLLCSLDGTIRFLDIKTGSMVLPTLTLSSPVVLSTFSPTTNLAGILTECGQLRIWNVLEQNVYLSSTCTDILSGFYATVLQITDNGVPFISLNSGSSYSFCKSLDSWLVLTSNDPVTRYGLATSNPASNVRNMKMYPLSTVQSIANASQSKTRNMVDLQSNVWQNSSVLSFIENQIKLSEMINSSSELKYWYSMFGYQLAQHGTEKKIRQILDDLMRPNTEEKVLDIPAHDLLEDILKQLKTEPKWQRLYTEYSEQLNFFKAMDTT